MVHLKMFGKVLVLHREVHGSLKTLVPSINYLSGQPIQSFLNIQIVVWVVQIVVSKPFINNNKRDYLFKRKRERHTQINLIWFTGWGEKRALPYFLRRLETDFMCKAASQFFFGSTIAFINDAIFIALSLSL